MPDHTPAARANCQSNGYFPSLQSSTRQQQIRNVYTGNQQHQAGNHCHHCRNTQKHFAEPARKISGGGERNEPLGLSPFDLAEPVMDDIHFRLRLLARHSTFQPAENPKAVLLGIRKGMG